MEELRDRLKKFHENEGVSYIKVAKALEISPAILYNFTSGVRDLKQCNAEILDEYLKERGY